MKEFASKRLRVVNLVVASRASLLAARAAESAERRAGNAAASGRNRRKHTSTQPCARASILLANSRKEPSRLAAWCKQLLQELTVEAHLMLSHGKLDHINLKT